MTALFRIDSIACPFFSVETVISSDRRLRPTHLVRGHCAETLHRHAAANVSPWRASTASSICTSLYVYGWTDSAWVRTVQEDGCLDMARPPLSTDAQSEAFGVLNPDHDVGVARHQPGARQARRENRAPRRVCFESDQMEHEFDEGRSKCSSPQRSHKP